jgi:hypothetical protein
VGLGLGFSPGSMKWALGLGERFGLFQEWEMVVLLVLLAMVEMLVLTEWGTRGSSRVENLGLLVEIAFLGRIWQFQPLEMVSNKLFFSFLYLFSLFFFFGCC